MNEELKQRIRLFAEDIRNGHKKRTYIKNLCKIIFSSIKDNSKDFIQIALRIKMEESDFAPNVVNTMLGEDIGESVALGEFNYIVKQLELLKEKRTIKEVNADMLLDLLYESQISFRPKFMLIPIESEYYHKAHDLINQGRARYENGEFVIDIGISKVAVIWSSNPRPFNDIFVLGEDCILLKYKEPKYMKQIPDEENHKRDLDERNSPLSIIYREEGGEIDFIFRTVIEAKVNQQWVHKYKIVKEKSA